MHSNSIMCFSSLHRIAISFLVEGKASFGVGWAGRGPMTMPERLGGLRAMGNTLKRKLLLIWRGDIILEVAPHIKLLRRVNLAVPHYLSLSHHSIVYHTCCTLLSAGLDSTTLTTTTTMCIGVGATNGT